MQTGRLKQKQFLDSGVLAPTSLRRRLKPFGVFAVGLRQGVYEAVSRQTGRVADQRGPGRGIIFDGLAELRVVAISSTLPEISVEKCRDGTLVVGAATKP